MLQTARYIQHKQHCIFIHNQQMHTFKYVLTTWYYTPNVSVTIFDHLQMNVQKCEQTTPKL